jgi:hypothetical protein
MITLQILSKKKNDKIQTQPPMTEKLDILGWSYVKTARQIWKFSAAPKQTDSFDSRVNN